MGKNSKTNYSIQSVEHALDLLEMLQGEEGEYGVSDLGRRMQLPKNKVFRLLSTLESHDFVEQSHHNGSYRLGFKTVGLRHTLVRHLKRCEWARPMLVAMATECRETVCYSVLSGFDIVTIDKVDGDQLLLASPQIGGAIPSHCTAAGKAMLADLDEDVLESYLSTRRLEKCTSHTLTSAARLRKELKLTAARGYAIAREELIAGMSGIASVVRDHTGRAVAAVSLLGPSHRFLDEEWLGKSIPLLLDLAARISARRGYCGSACGGASRVSARCRREGKEAVVASPAHAHAAGTVFPSRRAAGGDAAPTSPGLLSLE